MTMAIVAESGSVIQWNLSKAVTHEPKIFDLNREVAGIYWTSAQWPGEIVPCLALLHRFIITCIRT